MKGVRIYLVEICVTAAKQVSLSLPSGAKQKKKKKDKQKQK